MKAVLGGYFETAVVRHIDDILQPERNTTSHPYYMCINGKVAKSYFDRAATFSVLSDELIVPSIDWGPGGGLRDHSKLSTQGLGTIINGDEDFGGGEWDDDAHAFANIFISKRAFSPESWYTSRHSRRSGWSTFCCPGNRSSSTSVNSSAIGPSLHGAPAPGRRQRSKAAGTRATRNDPREDESDHGKQDHVAGHCNAVREA
jgi:hypothetical protein